jgi:hypothetical protein
MQYLQLSNTGRGITAYGLNKPIFVLLLLALFTTSYITGNKIYAFAWILWLHFILFILMPEWYCTTNNHTSSSLIDNRGP